MIRAVRASLRLSHTAVRLAHALASIALVASSASASCAVLEIPPLALLNHKTWTARDGAPQGVSSLTISPDGTLWIGSEGGLYIFDGRTFKPFRPRPGEADVPAGPIRTLTVARDGAIWAGTKKGCARIAHGHTTLFPDADGQPLGTILMMRAASDGSVWASGRNVVVRFDADGAAHRQPTPVPASTGRIGGIFIDASDTLWVGQSGKLYKRPISGETYTATDVSADYIFGFDEASDRSLWIADYDSAPGGTGRYQHVDTSGKLLATLPQADAPAGVLSMPDGSLIVASQFHGLRHFAAGYANAEGAVALEHSDVFTRAEGLTSDSLFALVRDADGNIWAGGFRGLDRLRIAQLTPFVSDTLAGTRSICTNSHGEVWIASTNAHSPLSKVVGRTHTTLPSPGDVYHMACGNDRDVWLVDGDGIANVHDDKVSRIPKIPGMSGYGVTELATAPGHVLYASVSAPPAVAGLWQFKEGQWRRFAGEGVFARGGLSLYVDSKNRVWSGYRNGIVGLPLEGNKTFLSGQPGLETVYAMLDTQLGMFAAGGNGLAILTGDAFEMLTFTDPGIARNVVAMVEAPNGDLWLNASRGLVHVPLHELGAALADRQHAIAAEVVTEGEFVGPAEITNRDSAARDASGQLWFSQLSGVFHLDPDHVAPDARPPVVSIHSIAVDGKNVAADAQIGPEPQTLTIQYLGVNLTAPEQVIYQYRLEGLEEAWQDAGHRTEAIYTRLPPGTYTFEVRASNGTGEWTAPVSAAAFTVAPAFYQTWWFHLLAIGAFLLLVFGLFRLRLRMAAHGIRARAEARADERIRIARDLHDTLLQGVQGLLLSVHVAAEQTPDSVGSKPMLRRALDSADRIIVEGRDRLSSLRAERLTDAELVGAIENVARDLATGHEAQYRVTRSGTQAALQTHVGDEIFYIAREALTNAFRHAEATEIDIAIDYGTQFFRLACADNGRGFDAVGTDKPDHFGLRGMFERARRLGGRFQCQSEPGNGTRISVTIPSFRAYRRSSRLLHYLCRLRAPKIT
jgi:signal transduction histidine kinase/ligand-binding sensor domain-containing protein